MLTDSSIGVEIDDKKFTEIVQCEDTKMDEDAFTLPIQNSSGSK